MSFALFLPLITARMRSFVVHFIASCQRSSVPCPQESPDTFFYGQPRFVTHIDDGAIAALTKWASGTRCPFSS